MRQSTRFWIGLAFLSAATAFSASLPPDGMALISNGVYRPLFADDSGTRETHVKSFYLDRLPVTVSDYLLFVNANPDWQKSRVKRIFADESYLENWDGDLNPGGNAPPNCAVTCVSWFAARAYAQWKGKRLPTIAEWERAAAASESSPDGASDPEFKRRTLQWYITPNAPLAQVGQRPPNFWGARDLDGLVWEWVVDFNSALVTIAPSATTWREWRPLLRSRGARCQELGGLSRVHALRISQQPGSKLLHPHSRFSLRQRFMKALVFSLSHPSWRWQPRATPATAARTR